MTDSLPPLHLPRETPLMRMMRSSLGTGALACSNASGQATRTRPAPTSAAAAARRSVLFNPDDPFWKEQAPAKSRVLMETTRGPFTMELTRALSPIGVDHFYNLVRAGYYDDSRFSRTDAGWIVQFGVAGDPQVSAV